MAYTKVSALTAKTTPAGTEELLINDGGVSKKITQTNLLSTALPLAGGTMTGDVSLGDNVKAKFGAGDDLQIYHTGLASFIEDVGPGGIVIKTNNISILSDTNESIAQFTSNGAVTLYHDNLSKLATTSTGIDVTGIVDASGVGKFSKPSDFWASTQAYYGGAYGNLTTNGAWEYEMTCNGYRNTSTQWTSLNTNSYTGATSISMNPQGHIRFCTDANKATGSGVDITERMRINSTGSVGIGTSSPAGKLHIDTDATASLASATINEVSDFSASSRVGFSGLTNNSDGMYFGMGVDGGVSAGMGFFRESVGWNSALAFYTNNQTSGTYGVDAIQEAMRIDSAGRVTMPNQPAFEVNITGSHANGHLTPTWGASWEVGSNVSTANKRFTAPVAGTYHFDAWIGYVGAWTANRVIIYLSVNGSDRVSHQNYRSGQDTGVNLSTNFQLSAGDYVSITLYQDSGGTRAIQSSVEWAGFGGYLIG